MMITKFLNLFLHTKLIPSEPLIFNSLLGVPLILKKLKCQLITYDINLYLFLLHDQIRVLIVNLYAHSSPLFSLINF